MMHRMKKQSEAARSVASSPSCAWNRVRVRVRVRRRVRVRVRVS